MDKEKFNSLSIDDQVIEFNALLDGSSIRQACTQIGIAKTTVRDRFKKHGYLFNAEENKYLYDKSGRIESDENTKNITASNIEKSKVKEHITSSNITKDTVIKKEDKDETKIDITLSNTEVTMSKEDITKSNITQINNTMILKMYEELQEVLLMKDELKELVKAKKREENIIEVEIPKLVLHAFKEAPRAKTLKYYGEVLTMLDSFMESHKNYSQQEIVSQALYEFLMKYK